MARAKRRASMASMAPINRSQRPASPRLQFDPNRQRWSTPFCLPPAGSLLFCFVLFKSLRKNPATEVNFSVFIVSNRFLHLFPAPPLHHSSTLNKRTKRTKRAKQTQKDTEFPPPSAFPSPFLPLLPPSPSFSLLPSLSLRFHCD